MAIIGTLPNNIQDGQLVDATPLMADFNFIVNQVNANANAIGTLTAPSGTRTTFHQAAAPSGWVQDVSINDYTLQVVNIAGGGTGGANGYSTMFSAAWTSDGHVLTQNELASHAHTIIDPSHLHSIGDPGHNHGALGGASFLTTAGGGANLNTSGAFSVATPSATATATTNISINPSNTGITINPTGANAAHSHTKTFNVNYITCIVGQKT
jgi:hypothetical protein